MFAVPTFGNFYQPFNAGFTPAGGQYGQPSTAQMFNPLIAAQLAALNPFAQPQIGGYGVNPLAVSALIGANPYLSSQYAMGLPAAINPFLTGQLPIMNPNLQPNLVPQIWGGAFRTQPQSGAFGIQSQLGLLNPHIEPYIGPYIGSVQQPFESGQFGHTPLGVQPNWQGLGNAGHWASNPFYAPTTAFGQALPGIVPQQAFGQNLATAQLTQDPITAASLHQQRLPIRPLLNPQQADPFQSGFGGPAGNPFTDPNFALNQAYMAQCGVSPLQQMTRGYTPNWGGSPYSIGQVSPLAQFGVPYNG